MARHGRVCSPAARTLARDASSTRILGDFSRSLLASNETFCVLNNPRRLKLSRPTLAPTATSSALCLTLHSLRRCVNKTASLGVRCCADAAVVTKKICPGTYTHAKAPPALSVGDICQRLCHERHHRGKPRGPSGPKLSSTWILG